MLACIIAGVVISLVLYKVSRRFVAFTVFLLPIVITAVVFTLKHQ